MIVAILKLLLLVSTGVFAVLGMWTKRKRRLLTKSIPFWGVVVTTLVSGLLLLVETNKASRDAVDAVKRQELLLNNLTGGDSYCFLAPGSIGEDHLVLALLNNGNFPLYDVTIEIVDEDVFKDKKLEGPPLWDFIQKNTLTFEQRTISPNAGKVLTTIDLTGLVQKRLHMNIWTRYRAFCSTNENR